MRFALSALVAFALTSAGSLPAAGQSALSLEGGALRGSDESIVQTGIRFTTLRPGTAALDLGLATFPQAIAAGFFLGMADLSLGYAAAAGPSTWIVPRAGVSVLAAAGDGGGGAVAGAGLGLGVVTRVGSHVGARLDFVQRYFAGSGESIELSSVSFGIAWIH